MFMTSIARDLVSSFKRATRLAFLREMPQFPAEISTGALIILIFLNIAASIGSEILDAGENLYFNSFGLNAHFASFVVVVILILVLGSKSGLPSPQRIITDISSLGIWFFALSAGLFYASPPLIERFNLQPAAHKIVQELPLLILGIWALAALWWTGRTLWRGHLRFPGLRFVFVVVAPMFLVPHQAAFSGNTTDWARYDIWHWGEKAAYALFPQTASSKKRAPRIDVEAAYYRQPALVKKALEKLKPSSGKVPKFYFVGAAPDASQLVFKREVLAAQIMFDTRFNTKDRSLVLINNRKTIGTIPMANASNLGLALEGVGKKMDVEKDVLILFITTHGGTRQLSVRFSRFYPNNLSAQRLAKILKKSKIKHKVLIISACYSGSFIPALKDKNTLIMTASHAERSSFGCSNERDWTYFGDALINRALRSTRSLTHAFLQARAMIAKWEAKEGIEASEPQISVGELIGTKLDSLMTGLEDIERKAKVSSARGDGTVHHQKQVQNQHTTQ